MFEEEQTTLAHIRQLAVGGRGTQFYNLLIDRVETLMLTWDDAQLSDEETVRLRVTAQRLLNDLERLKRARR